MDSVCHPTRDAPESILTPAQLDHVALALIELAKELWVTKDRLIVTEALLREKNIVPELDAYQPGPELAARLTAERERFLGALTSILFAVPASAGLSASTGEQ